MVEIQFTKFADLTADGHEETVTYGYRISDQTGEMTYNNAFESPEQVAEYLHPGNVLAFLHDNHHQFWAEASAKGLYLNGTYYSPAQLGN